MPATFEMKVRVANAIAAWLLYKYIVYTQFCIKERVPKRNTWKNQTVSFVVFPHYRNTQLFFGVKHLPGKQWYIIVCLKIEKMCVFWGAIFDIETGYWDI